MPQESSLSKDWVHPEHCIPIKCIPAADRLFPHPCEITAIDSATLTWTNIVWWLNINKLKQNCKKSLGPWYLVKFFKLQETNDETRKFILIPHYKDTEL